MLDNYHVTDMPPHEGFYFADEEPVSAPAVPAPVPAPSPPAPVQQAPKGPASTNKGKGKKMMLYLILIIAILALVYGIYCMTQNKAGGSQKLYFM